MIADAARARDALYAIPPDLPRDEWVRAGMAAHAAGLSLDDFDQWSAMADNYLNRKDCAAVWKGFGPGSVTEATLFGMARDHGWQGNNATRQAPAKPTARRAEPPRKPTPGIGASEVFNRCEPATNGHGYIVAKDAAGVPLDNLRVVPAGDPLRIAGESMAGYLAVPAYAPDGKIQSIQFIPPPGIGKKLNLPGASMAGASFTVGTLVTGGVAHICEGIGAAWSCWQATGAAAVVAFGWGNVGKVASALRQRDATARLVICPDVGKEKQAAEIATELQCAVAYLPATEPDNFDANDLMARDGGDVLQALLLSASEPPKPEPLLKPVSVGDVLTLPSPPPAFVWDGYLPRGEVALLGAHGGTGKSTIALMLAVCAALGRPLFGVDTVCCKAVFVSLEDGAHVVRHRLAHICKTWGIDPELLRDRLFIVDGTEHPELFTAETRAAGATTATYTELHKLVQSVGAGLVVVDNASDAFGGDEIQRRQVRAFMRALAEVARLTDCAVLLLAHVDKQTSRNRAAAGGEAYSGSTAWHNSARSRLFLTRGEDGLLTLEHQKSNLGRMREPLTLAWPDGGLPMLASEAPDFSGLTDRANGRAEDARAVEVLKLIAEFEGRGQYCSPVATARNNVFAMLRSEPAFQTLKLTSDSSRRVVTTCQRAKWLEPVDYRKADRKRGERWTLTPEGRAIAGLFAASAACPRLVEETAQTAGLAASAACPRGVRGESAHIQQTASGVPA